MNFVPDHALILTPSARLARSLQLAHAQKNIGAGRKHWPSLNVKTLTQWLDETITAALLTGEIDVTHMPEKCLTALEERMLWQEVVSQHLKAHDFSALFDLSGLADVCVEANKYAVAWQLPLENIASQSAQETQYFLRWQQLFRARCRALNVLENVRYIDWQIACLENNIQHLPQTIYFAGFDQAAPQEKKLRAVLEKRGCEIFTYNTGQDFPAEVAKVALPTQMDELRSVAAWAKTTLDENPQAKLAIVVPNLTTLRNRLADLLDDVFASATVCPSQTEVPRIYNFSLGLPLSEQPMIHMALHLLTLFSRHAVQQTDLSTALLSPDWSAGQTEADARALLEAAMREKLPLNTHWPNAMRFIVQQNTTLNISTLLADCEAAHALMQSQPRRQPPSVWAGVFSKLLAALGWPGQRAESSHEYQARQAWEKTLQQLARMDFLDAKLSASAAAQLIRNICAEQVFQPETEGEPAIQLMGMMEALSAPVDAMWVMGMNDDVWPPPARPNPLLPAHLQRAAKVANADSTVQAAFAQGIHARLMASASNIIFSYCQQEGEKALRASPLMQDIPAFSGNISPANTLAETLVAQSAHALQFLADTVAPSVVEGEHVRGGTGLMRAQAICPAWAFYQFRLGAKKLKSPKNGLDAAERGQLLHLALEQFWRQEHHYRHFADLQRMGEPELLAAVDLAAKNAVQLFSTQQTEHFPQAILALEEERLRLLLLGWLNFELEQAEFFTMHACEAEKKVNIDGIEVTLKIDRVHRTENGGLVLVDYKTGLLPAIKNWGEDRLTEPQLPIYALFYPQNDEHVTGVLFAQVKMADYGFSGLTEAQFVEEIEKRKPEFIRAFADWEGMKQHWQQAILNIVAEIKAGVAPVVFSRLSDLTYCDVRPLLRIPERQLQFERQLKTEVNP